MPITSMSQVGPLLQVTATVDDTTVSAATLGGVLVLSQHSVFAARYLRLDGDANTVPAAMIAMGFSFYSSEVQSVKRVFSGRVPITYILLGRRAPVDPTWGVALTAIKVALDVGQETVVHVYAALRVESQQRAIAAYCSAQGWLFTLATPSVGVRNNALGSLEKLIQGDGSLCNIISYDPATESGAAAPTVHSGPENYTLTGYDDTALTVSLALSIQQDVDTPEAVVFTASRAQVNAGAGPYNLEPGWILAAGVDGLGPWPATIAATAAIMTSISGPFLLVNGQVVQVVVNEVPYTYSVTAANYANILAATATEIAAEAMLLAPLAAVLTLSDSAGAVRGTTVRRGHGASWRMGANTAPAFLAALGFSVAGATGTGNVGNVDAVTATELQTLVTAASGLTFAQNIAGLLRFRSFRAGTGATVALDATSTAGLLTALTLGAGVTAGSGDAVNAGATTSTELYTVLSALTGPTVTVTATGTVKLAGTKGTGALHTLYLVGPLADALGIAGTFAGAGIAEDWADASLIGARAGLALDSAPPDAGHLTWNDVSVLGAYGTRSLTVSEMKRLNRTQHVNTFCLINPARGPEFHDGRLSLPFASGSPAFVDQWIATRWIAQYLIATFVARLAALSDVNDQLAFFSEAAYAPFILACVGDVEAVGVRSKALAFVDTTAPTVNKPTGVIVVPKINLSPSLLQQRQGQVIVRCQLASALHGLLAQVTLNV